jgi:hypothetical protein
MKKIILPTGGIIVSNQQTNPTFDDNLIRLITINCAVQKTHSN